MKPRILILDDDPERHRVFAQYFQGRATLTHAMTASEFSRKFFQGGPWDLVLLDYDLHLCQPEELVESGGHLERATGDHAAALLAAAYGQADRTTEPVVVVHSMNPLGAAKMMRTLRSAGIYVERHVFRADGLDAWLNG